MLVDVGGVLGRREELLERTRHPLFAAWWERYLATQRERLGELPDAADGSDAARHRWAAERANQAEELALAAQLTGDEELGRRAVDLLLQSVADELPWMSPEHKHHYPELDADLLVAERTKRVVAAASWADPWLSEPDREAVAAALRLKGGEVIFRDSGRGAWWATAWNSNWCAVLNSGLGLAALYLDEPAWLARAVTAIERVLDISVHDGSGVEGIGYWTYCFTSSLDLAEPLAAGGDDSLWQHPFWAKAAEFPLHLALPDLSGWVNFGDCGYPGLGGASLLFAIAARTGCGLAQWLALQIAGDRPGLRDFLRCDPSVPATPPDALPTCRLFVTAQIASLRDSWSPEATHFVFKGGSNAWSHCHLDLNSFVLTAAGERLALDPGPWPYTPHYWTSVEPPQSTAWHNTLTVDGADQRQPPRYRLTANPADGGDAYSLLDRWADNEWASVIRGDATTAYADTLERYHRWVVYLKPDAFLIYDDILTRDDRTQRHLQWLLHAEHDIEDLPDGVRVRGAKAQMTARFLLPQPAVWKHLPDRQPIGHGDRPPVHAVALRQSFYHLWNVSPSRSPHPQWDEQGGERLYGPDYRFLVLLQVAGADEEPRAWEAQVAEGGQVVEVGLRRGVEQVTVRLATSHAEVARSAGGATELLRAVGR